MVTYCNKSYHRAIGCRPIDVNKNNVDSIKLRLNGDDKMLLNFDFKIGDFEREKVKKTIFAIGYTPNWSKLE